MIFSSDQTNWKKPWQRGFFYALLLLLLLVIGGVTFLVSFCFRHNELSSPEPSSVRKYVQNGDIILRSGVGLWSGYFRKRNTVDQRFSHVGIVLIDQDGTCNVLHAEGDDLTGNGQVGICSLETFVNESDLIGISRLKYIDPEQFVLNAKTFIGRPFDWKFNLAEDDKIYCTELIDLALKKTVSGAGLKVTDDLILPEACLDNTIFEEVAIEN